MTDNNRTRNYCSLTRSTLALAGAVGLMVLSAGSAAALPPLDAVEDIGTPLATDGSLTGFPLLANDTGQNGAPADCSSAITNNCLFDPALLVQAGVNGDLTINDETGEAEYFTSIDPAADQAGYDALIAGLPACTGVIDTFQYTLIGAAAEVAVVPASTDTASLAITVGTALRQIAAADDSGASAAGAPIAVNVLANDCDQTNSTPAQVANLSPAVSTAAVNGSTVVNPNGTITYTPNAGFVGTDSFVYTNTTIDAGAARTASATVTITVTAAPPVVLPPPGAPGPPAPAPAPGLPATGADNVLPIALGGSGLLLLGSVMVLLGRRRRTEIG